MPDTSKIISVVYINDLYDIMSVDIITEEKKDLIERLGKKDEKIIIPVFDAPDEYQPEFQILRKEIFEINIRYYLINYYDDKRKINRYFTKYLKKEIILLPEKTEKNLIELYDSCFLSALNTNQDDLELEEIEFQSNLEP